MCELPLHSIRTCMASKPQKVIVAGRLAYQSRELLCGVPAAPSRKRRLVTKTGTQKYDANELLTLSVSGPNRSPVRGSTIVRIAIAHFRGGGGGRPR